MPTLDERVAFLERAMNDHNSHCAALRADMHGVRGEIAQVRSEMGDVRREMSDVRSAMGLSSHATTTQIVDCQRWSPTMSSVTVSLLSEWQNPPRLPRSDGVRTHAFRADGARVRCVATRYGSCSDDDVESGKNDGPDGSESRDVDRGTVAYLEGRMEDHGRQTGELQAVVRESRDEMHRRFDAVDGRFDAVNRRFDAIDGRFAAVDGRFTAVDARFDAVASEFAQLRGEMSRRFEAVDGHFAEIRSDMRQQLLWIIGFQFTVLLAVVGVLLNLP